MTKAERHLKSNASPPGTDLRTEHPLMAFARHAEAIRRQQLRRRLEREIKADLDHGRG